MAIYTAKYESGNSIQTIEIEADDLDNTQKDVVTLSLNTEKGWISVATFNREKLLLVYRDESKQQ